MFGSHLSIAGGMHNALTEAKTLGLEAVQIFTKNQRQWTPPKLTEENIRDWKKTQKETGVKYAVSHDSYLINLASPVEENRSRSIDLFRDELTRCEALGIPHLITHPGAHMGAGEEPGLTLVADSLNRLHKDLPGLKTVTLLEITAGQGTSLGTTFAQLKFIRDRVTEMDRVAVCLDTAHLLEAGYDLTSEKGAKATFAECDEVLGLELVKCIHVNDSKTPRGSRVDRHEHIGKGHVAIEAFGVLVRHKAFKKTPMILETPKDVSPDGRQWDLVNVEILRGLRSGKK